MNSENKSPGELRAEAMIARHARKVERAAARKAAATAAEANRAAMLAFRAGLAERAEKAS